MVPIDYRRLENIHTSSKNTTRPDLTREGPKNKKHKQNTAQMRHQVPTGQDRHRHELLGLGCSIVEPLDQSHRCLSNPGRNVRAAGGLGGRRKHYRAGSCGSNKELEHRLYRYMIFILTIHPSTWMYYTYHFFQGCFPRSWSS